MPPACAALPDGRLTAAAAATARLNGVSRVETVPRNDDPAAGILALAEERHPDLVIVGRNGLSHSAVLPPGVLSDKVVRMSRCSLMMAR